MSNGIITREELKELLQRFDIEVTPFVEIKDRDLDFALATHLRACDIEYVLVISMYWLKNKKSFDDIKKQVKAEFGFKELQLVPVKGANEFSSNEDKYSFQQDNKYGLVIDNEYEPEHEYFICLLKVQDR